MRHLAQQWRQAASGVDVVINKSDWSSTFEAVASEGGEVVGKCSLWVRDDGAGYVQRVYVTPSHRRRGIASQMLRVLLDHTGATLRTRGIGDTSPSGAAFLSGFSGDDVPATWGTDGKWEDWLRTSSSEVSISVERTPGGSVDVFARQQGEIVGIARMMADSYLYGGPWVGSVYVAPSHRRRGIASEMLHAGARELGLPVDAFGSDDLSPSGAALLEAVTGRPQPAPKVDEGTVEENLRRRIERSAVTPLHDTRHGTPPKVEGDSLSAILSGRSGIVMYDRATDTLYVSATEPGSRPYPDNDHPGMSSERRDELKRYRDDPRVDFISSEFKDGFGLLLSGGHIEPYTGGMGGAPNRATMFNPLGVEALARLLDAEPAFGRWMTHEQQSFYGDRGPSYTARDWVARYSDMRSTFAARTANSWSHLTLFHGTCDYWSQRILRDGLRPRTDTGVRGGWSDDALSHDGRVYLASRGANILSSAMRNAVENAVYDAYRDRIAALLPEWEYDGNNLSVLAIKFSRWGDGQFQYGDPHIRDDEESLAEARDLSSRINEGLRGEGQFAPVLLEVKVPREHWGKFEADEDTYSYSVPGAGETGMPEWLLSLGVDAVVAYRGTIPASWIAVAQKGWR